MLRRLLFVAVLLGLSASPARAFRIYIPPAPERLAQCSCVVMGKVAEIEKNTVKAAAAPGDAQKQEYQVAVIKVDEGLLGAQGLTHVRVGLLGPAVTVGQEGCFFLNPHHDQTFFVMTQPQGFIAKGSDAASVDLVRRCGKLLKDPLASLQAKDAEDRFLTAAMLVARHRGGAVGAPPGKKAEPIAAEESKLILLALRDVDWNRNAADRISPQQVFARLGLTPQDGWQQPKDFKQYQAAAKEWLTKNAGSYRIQRFVPDKK